MKEHKIIVTGGCGYIGSHTVVELIQNDFDVVIFDNMSNSKDFIVSRIEEITKIKPKLVKVDLSDALQTEKAYDGTAG